MYESSLCTILYGIKESEDNLNNTLEMALSIEESVSRFDIEEVIRESGDNKSIFTRIKEFFLNLMKSIQRLFKTAILKIQAKLKSDEDFVKKIEKLKILDKDISGLKMELFNIEPDKIDLSKTVNSLINKSDDKFGGPVPSLQSNSEGSNPSYDNYIKNYKNINNIFNEFRGDIIHSLGGDNKNTFPKEFKDKVMNCLRNGTEKKEIQITTDILKNCISDLKENSQHIKDLESSAKAARGILDEVINNISKMERTAKKTYSDNDYLEVMNIFKNTTTAYKQVGDILAVLSSCKVQANVELIKMEKSILIKAYSYKSGSKTEENKIKSMNTESAFNHILFK